MTAPTFLDVFTTGWSRQRTLEEFLEHFLQHVDRHVELNQPLSNTERGHQGFEAVFRRLFTLMPDVQGDVLEAIEREYGLLIVLRLRGTLGRRPFAWTVVDRIETSDERLIRRQAFFDPLPLLAAIAGRPSAWPRAIAALAR